MFVDANMPLGRDKQGGIGSLNDSQTVDFIAGLEFLHLPDIGFLPLTLLEDLTDALSGIRVRCFGRQRVLAQFRLHRIDLGDHTHLTDVIRGHLSSGSRGEHPGVEILKGLQQRG